MKWTGVFFAQYARLARSLVVPETEETKKGSQSGSKATAKDEEDEYAEGLL